jgi:hypothetical protein
MSGSRTSSHHGALRLITGLCLAIAVFISGGGVAQAARSGTWGDDFFVHWSADTTWTRIEPHNFTTTAQACIGRYYAGAVRFYYGPAVMNYNALEHRTSYVSATNGTYSQNCFYLVGRSRYRL